MKSLIIPRIPQEKLHIVQYVQEEESSRLKQEVEQHEQTTSSQWQKALR
jgi:hypothetical protein